MSAELSPNKICLRSAERLAELAKRAMRDTDGTMALAMSGPCSLNDKVHIGWYFADLEQHEGNAAVVGMAANALQSTLDNLLNNPLSAFERERILRFRTDLGAAMDRMNAPA